MYSGLNFKHAYYKNSLENLKTALQSVPAYKSWKQYFAGYDSDIDALYANLPVLTKRDLRQYCPMGFIPATQNLDAGLSNGDIEFEVTSGTTDEKVTNIWYQKWWDASERASWKLNSHTERISQNNFREAILANPPNVGWISDESDLSFDQRSLSRFLFLNEKTQPSLWTVSHMDRMINELRIFQPSILEADPVVLARLCRYIKNSGNEVFQPELIVLTYEYPTQNHLRQIRQVFDVPMASSYGSTETGFVFMQCEKGKYHQNNDFCRVDIEALKLEHGGPQLGRILVTTFNNPWYYLIHFDVGDIVIIDEKNQCQCGRDTGFILSGIAGRVSNLTVTDTGRLVTLYELDNEISVLEDIDDYRLNQIGTNLYHLQIVSQREDDLKLEKEAKEVLTNLYGEKISLSVSHDAYISPEKSGKFIIAQNTSPINIEKYLDRNNIAHQPCPV